MVSLASKRIVSDYLQLTYKISERRSCRTINLYRATKRNKPTANQDQQLREEIHRLSIRYPRFGYRKIYDKLKEVGWRVGRERVRLIRQQEGLEVGQLSWTTKRQSKCRLILLRRLFHYCQRGYPLWQLLLVIFHRFIAIKCKMRPGGVIEIKPSHQYSAKIDVSFMFSKINTLIFKRLPQPLDHCFI
ncbi:IS3 family transposase [Thermodesulfobacteriota bacterium]